VMTSIPKMDFVYGTYFMFFNFFFFLGDIMQVTTSMLKTDFAKGTNIHSVF